MGNIGNKLSPQNYIIHYQLTIYLNQHGNMAAKLNKE